MKDIRMILPNMASDTAGAASALFAMDGLTVIHDAAGSMESFITFDEARELAGKRTVASRLSRLEAVTGDDGILLDKLAEECAADAPPFIALIGSPVPFTIGTDLEGIAAEGEYRTGVPAVAVTAGGFASYDKGAGEALRKILEKKTRDPADRDASTVNLLGATPMDYSDAEIEGLRQTLLKEGAAQVRTLSMAHGVEEVIRAAEAGRNVVISAAGLPAARYLEKRWGIPYTVGVPVETAFPADIPEGRTVLILGESVLSRQLALELRQAGVDAVAGITVGDDPEICPEVPAILLDTEAGIRDELKKNYFAVVGDPLYKLLLPRNSKTKFVERPHRALSGRLYPPVSVPLEQLLTELKEVLV